MSQVRKEPETTKDLDRIDLTSVGQKFRDGAPGTSQALGALRLDSNARLLIIVARGNSVAAYLRSESHGSLLEGFGDAESRNSSSGLCELSQNSF